MLLRQHNLSLVNSARNFGRDRRYPIVNKLREDLGTPASKGAARAAPSGEAPRLVRPRRDGGDLPYPVLAAAAGSKPAQCADAVVSKKKMGGRMK